MANRDYGTSVFRVGTLFRLQLPELPGVRGPNGRFTTGGYSSAQNEMRSRNREFAVALQGQVVRNIQERMEPKRAAASTGRLLKVTAAPENAEYDTWSAGVGNEAFLNSSIAKYWRTFEEGSAGLWKRPFIGTQLMPKGNNAPYPVAHGAVPGIRTMRPGAKRLAWMDGEKYVVKREIAPSWAYRDAVAKANPRKFAFYSATQLIRRVYGLGPEGSGGYFA